MMVSQKWIFLLLHLLILSAAEQSHQTGESSVEPVLASDLHSDQEPSVDSRTEDSKQIVNVAISSSSRGELLAWVLPQQMLNEYYSQNQLKEPLDLSATALQIAGIVSKYMNKSRTPQFEEAVAQYVESPGRPPRFRLLNSSISDPVVLAKTFDSVLVQKNSGNSIVSSSKSVPLSLVPKLTEVINSLSNGAPNGTRNVINIFFINFINDSNLHMPSLASPIYSPKPAHLPVHPLYTTTPGPIGPVTEIILTLKEKLFGFKFPVSSQSPSYKPFEIPIILDQNNEHRNIESIYKLLRLGKQREQLNLPVFEKHGGNHLFGGADIESNFFRKIEPSFIQNYHNLSGISSTETPFPTKDSVSVSNKTVPDDESQKDAYPFKNLRKKREGLGFPRLVKSSWSYYFINHRTKRDSGKPAIMPLKNPDLAVPSKLVTLENSDATLPSKSGSPNNSPLGALDNPDSLPLSKAVSPDHPDSSPPSKAVSPDNPDSSPPSKAVSPDNPDSSSHIKSVILDNSNLSLPPSKSVAPDNQDLLSPSKTLQKYRRNDKIGKDFLSNLPQHEPKATISGKDKIALDTNNFNAWLPFLLGQRHFEKSSSTTKSTDYTPQFTVFPESTQINHNTDRTEQNRHFHTDFDNGDLETRFETTTYPEKLLPDESLVESHLKEKVHRHNPGQHHASNINWFNFLSHKPATANEEEDFYDFFNAEQTEKPIYSVAKPSQSTDIVQNFFESALGELSNPSTPTDIRPLYNRLPAVPIRHMLTKAPIDFKTQPTPNLPKKSTESSTTTTATSTSGEEASIEPLEVIIPRPSPILNLTILSGSLNKPKPSKPEIVHPFPATDSPVTFINLIKHPTFKPFQTKPVQGQYENKFQLKPSILLKLKPKPTPSQLERPSSSQNPPTNPFQNINFLSSTEFSVPQKTRLPSSGLIHNFFLHNLQTVDNTHSSEFPSVFYPETTSKATTPATILIHQFLLSHQKDFTTPSDLYDFSSTESSTDNLPSTTTTTTGLFQNTFATKPEVTTSKESPETDATTEKQTHFDYVSVPSTLDTLSTEETTKPSYYTTFHSSGETSKPYYTTFQSSEETSKPSYHSTFNHTSETTRPFDYSTVRPSAEFTVPYYSTFRPPAETGRPPYYSTFLPSAETARPPYYSTFRPSAETARPPYYSTFHPSPETVRPPYYSTFRPSPETARPSYYSTFRPSAETARPSHHSTLRPFAETIRPSYSTFRPSTGTTRPSYYSTSYRPEETTRPYSSSFHSSEGTTTPSSQSSSHDSTGSTKPSNYNTFHLFSETSKPSYYSTFHPYGETSSTIANFPLESATTTEASSLPETLSTGTFIPTNDESTLLSEKVDGNTTDSNLEYYTYPQPESNLVHNYPSVSFVSGFQGQQDYLQYIYGNYTNNKNKTIHTSDSYDNNQTSLGFPTLPPIHSIPSVSYVSGSQEHLDYLHHIYGQYNGNKTTQNSPTLPPVHTFPSVSYVSGSQEHLDNLHDKLHGDDSGHGGHDHHSSDDNTDKKPPFVPSFLAVEAEVDGNDHSNLHPEGESEGDTLPVIVETVGESPDDEDSSPSFPVLPVVVAAPAPAAAAPVVVFKAGTTTTTTTTTTASSSSVTQTTSIFGQIANSGFLTIQLIGAALIYIAAALLPLWLPVILDMGRNRRSTHPQMEFLEKNSHTVDDLASILLQDIGKFSVMYDNIYYIPTRTS